VSKISFEGAFLRMWGMKMKKLATILSFLLVYYSVPTAFAEGRPCAVLNQEKFGWFCEIWGDGDETNSYPLSNDSMSVLERKPVSEPVPSGYSIVRFSIGADDGEKLVFDRSEVRSFASRSFSEWARIVFANSGKTYLMSLDLHENGKLIDHKPIFALKAGETFNSMISDSEVALNGYLGFQRRTDVLREIVLEIREIDSHEFTAENVVNLIELVSSASRYNLAFSSLVDESTISDYNSDIGQIAASLSRFKNVSRLRKRVVLSSRSGGTSGFTYRFSPPDEVGLPSIVLAVALDYSPSLLSQSGDIPSEDILSKQMHVKDGAGTDVRSFIEQHDSLKERIMALKSGSGEVEGLCARIKSSLNRHFVARDSAIVLNSYVDANSHYFRDVWTPRCLKPADIKLLESHGVTPVEFEVVQ